MLFWLLTAALTVLVTVWVLRPVLTQQETDAVGHEADLAVYRDQLLEVDRDLARGVLSKAEAESARAEVSRRILANERQVAAAQQQQRLALGLSPVTVFYGGAAAIIATTLGLYLAVGSPGYGGRPHAERASAPVQGAPVTELVARVEARLREEPEDGRGWDVLAPVYMRLERPGDAALAYRQAIRILGESMARLRGLAEAVLADNNGIVTEEVRTAYQKMLAKEPGLVAPRFWLAVGLEQDGDQARARAAYTALLGKDGKGDGALPPALVKLIGERLAAVGGKPPASSAGTAAVVEGRPEAGKVEGPDPSAAAGISALPADQQAAMIEQMVSGLAERLSGGGGSLAEWQRLIRAYVVLGKRDRAQSALDDARRDLKSDPAALTELDTFATSQGLGPG